MFSAFKHGNFLFSSINFHLPRSQPPSSLRLFRSPAPVSFHLAICLSFRLLIHSLLWIYSVVFYSPIRRFYCKFPNNRNSLLNFLFVYLRCCVVMLLCYAFFYMYMRSKIYCMHSDYKNYEPSRTITPWLERRLKWYYLLG